MCFPILQFKQWPHVIVYMYFEGISICIIEEKKKLFGNFRNKATMQSEPVWQPQYYNIKFSLLTKFAYLSFSTDFCVCVRFILTEILIYRIHISRKFEFYQIQILPKFQLEWMHATIINTGNMWNHKKKLSSIYSLKKLIPCLQKCG